MLLLSQRAHTADTRSRVSIPLRHRPLRAAKMIERGAIAVFFNTPLVLSSGVPPVLMAGARFFAGLSMALATKEVAKTAAKLLGMCGRDARKRGAGMCARR